MHKLLLKREHDMHSHKKKTTKTRRINVIHDPYTTQLHPKNDKQVSMLFMNEFVSCSRETNFNRTYQKQLVLKVA